MNLSFSYVGSLLLLALAVLGTSIVSSSGSSSPVWADVIEDTEGDDFIVGTAGDDIIDSKGGSDANLGDSFDGDGSGDDIILSGEEADTNTGSVGRDIFVCGEGEDTITDFNEAEGDIATPDCENV